jgi:hypothetical protein
MQLIQKLIINVPSEKFLLLIFYQKINNNQVLKSYVYSCKNFRLRPSKKNMG